jgi:hypothetical protein
MFGVDNRHLPDLPAVVRWGPPARTSVARLDSLS